jgi:hypothetical protein
VIEYFHGLVYITTTLHCNDEYKRMAKVRENLNADESKSVLDKWRKREEVFVHGLVAVWLEDFLKRNNNMGMNEREVRHCYENLDRGIYVGARPMMKVIQDIGPGEAYRLYKKDPDTLFRKIGL